MAYTVQNAIDYIRPFIKNVQTAAVHVVAADHVNSIMWAYYPWRWAVTTLTPITLVHGQQDYVTVPADYLRLAHARLVRTDTDPDEYGEPLTIVRQIEPRLVNMDWRNIELISMEGHLNKFRLDSAVQITSPEVVKIDGDYQKLPTKITNASDSLLFPEMYFNVFCAGFMWRLYKFADDARAGEIRTDRRGNPVFTGALGEFMGSLYDMASSEGATSGDTIAPSEALLVE